VAKIKGIGIIGIVKALRSRRAEAEQKLPVSLQRYLYDRIVIAAWYPEQDYLALLRVFVAMWRIRSFEQVGVTAAQERLKGVYRNIVGGNVLEATSRMRANWRNYHDTGELTVDGHSGMVRVMIRDYAMVSSDLCLLNQGYIAEHLRLSGATVSTQRKVRCTVHRDTHCEWEFDLEPRTGSGSR
jgi:hypothetical protein